MARYSFDTRAADHAVTITVTAATYQEAEDVFAAMSAKLRVAEPAPAAATDELVPANDGPVPMNAPTEPPIPADKRTWSDRLATANEVRRLGFHGELDGPLIVAVGWSGRWRALRAAVPSVVGMGKDDLARWPSLWFSISPGIPSQYGEADPVRFVFVIDGVVVDGEGQICTFAIRDGFALERLAPRHAPALYAYGLEILKGARAYGQAGRP
jgi:hypothetical protein